MQCIYSDSIAGVMVSILPRSQRSPISMRMRAEAVLHVNKFRGLSSPLASVAVRTIFFTCKHTRYYFNFTQKSSVWRHNKSLAQNLLS